MTVKFASSSLCFLLLAQTAICIKLIATDVTENAKMTCQNVKGTVYTVKSEMQCHHRCLRKEKCEILNYKSSNEEDGSEKDNCEVFDVPSCNHICKKTSSNANWKTVVVMRQRDRNNKVYDSCKEIYEDKPCSTSAVYDLTSGKHHCVMKSLSGCGGGGWTLAMKINGTKSTFSSTSSYWESDTIYNVENGLKSFENEEAKFPGFSSIAFKSICLGMRASGTTVWIRVTTTQSSLADVFKTGNYQETNLQKSKWMSLISGAIMQSNCNRQGFNVKDDSNEMYARIGIVSNQENDCSSPDSFLGFGTIFHTFGCNASLAPISCGNFASCSSRDQSIAAMGYILANNIDGHIFI